MLVGYARVSSTGQSLDVQQEALAAAGCDKVFSEKRSGLSAVNRDQLAECIDFVRDGDTFVVTRLDRLARSVDDLRAIVNKLTAKGVTFRCIEQGGADTDSSSGKLLLGMLGLIAEFEADIRKERQMEGIAKAKERGVYKGRKPSVDRDRVREMKAGGMGATAIADEMGIGRASVYRALAG